MTDPTPKPTQRIARDQLGLEIFMSFDYHQDEIISHVFQSATVVIEDALRRAQEQARVNVGKAAGPSQHDGKGDDGHHTEIHGFEWRDAGKGKGGLADAIKYRVNWKTLKSGKNVGMPRGQLYVEPIVATNSYTGQKRKINYGAYLEFGFRPVIQRKTSAGVVAVRGNFTRYPFLSPAMHAAAGGARNIGHLFAVTLRAELRNMAATTPGKRKGKRIIEKMEITADTMRRQFRGQIIHAVQGVSFTSYEASKKLIEDTEMTRLAERIEARKAAEAAEAAKAKKKADAAAARAAVKEAARIHNAKLKEEAEKRAAAERAEVEAAEAARREYLRNNPHEDPEVIEKHRLAKIAEKNRERALKGVATKAKKAELEAAEEAAKAREATLQRIRERMEAHNASVAAAKLTKEEEKGGGS